MTFEGPDPHRFPALAIAREALAAGGGAPTVLNAANEVAVEAFLTGRLGFLDIARVVAAALERLPGRALSSLAEVEAVDAEARRVAEGLIGRF